MITLKLVPTGSFTRLFDFCYYTIAKNNGRTVPEIFDDFAPNHFYEYDYDSFYRSQYPYLQTNADSLKFAKKYKNENVKILYPILDPKKRFKILLRRYMKVNAANNTLDEAIDSLYNLVSIRQIYDYTEVNIDYDICYRLKNFSYIYLNIYRAENKTDVIFFNEDMVLKNYDKLVKRLELSKYNMDWKDDIVSKSRRVTYNYPAERSDAAIKYYYSHFIHTDELNNILEDYFKIKKILKM